jgi:hypothetical protein
MAGRKHKTHRSVNKEEAQPGLIQTGDIEGSNIVVGHGAQITQITIYAQASSQKVSAQGSHILQHVNSLLIQELEQAAGVLSTEIEKRLEDMREAIREGRKREVIEWINEQKSDQQRWSILDPSVKAKILRFESGLILDHTGDTKKAKELADEAHALSPSDNEIRLRVLIAYWEQGAQTGLELINGQQDIDSLNLKALFLLELGNVQECLRVLDVVGKEIDPNAETFRIRALAHVLLRELSQSRTEIEKALKLAPRWQTNQFTSALIDYLSALSPAALPEHLINWPAPVTWELVKNDNGSIASLQKAAAVFRNLADRAEEQKERLSFEVWLLACLACNPVKQTEAKKVCQAMLQADPTNLGAIVWCTTRRYNVELEPSKKVLKGLVKDQTAKIPDALALASIYFADRKPKSAYYLLNRTKRIFIEAKAENLWTFWVIQAHVASGNHKAALRIIKSSGQKSALREAQILVYELQAKKIGHWEPLIEHLEDSYEQTGDSLYLFILCQWKAQLQDWFYIAFRAEELVRVIQTSEALELAAIAAYNAQDPDLCLDLLKEHQDYFQERKIPARLQRVRSLCYFDLGNWSKAVAEAEDLADEEPTLENQLALADLYFRTGDLRSLVLLARKLIKSDLPPEIALQLSGLVSWEDRELAQSLWRKALEHELPEALVGDALYLGFQLGLDRDLRFLSEKVQDLGQQGKGGIQAATLEDFKSFIIQQQKEEAELNDLYQKGTIPIHFLAEQLNFPLVTPYHVLLENNENAIEPLKQPAPLVHYGGRSIPDDFPDGRPDWQLHIDITALLLAAHFEILPELERVFKPLRIPPEIPRLLIQMREKILPVQPSVLDNYRKIKELAENGSIKLIDTSLPPNYPNNQISKELGSEWAVLFERASSESGYLIDFLPLRSRDLSRPLANPPEEIEKYVTNCRGILDALREQGPLSEKDYEKALEDLGREGLKAELGVIPIAGSSLYCYANTPEVLAGVGILAITCERFNVFIEKSEYDRASRELNTHANMLYVAEWLDSLRERIVQGLQDGIYEVIKVKSFRNENVRDIPPAHLYTQSMLTLMQFEAKQGDVIWIDDRFMNSFSGRDTVPFVTIIDMLRSLVGAGALSLNDYYHKLIRLRSTNIRFIPIQSGEILHHLRQARVRNGQTIETRELRIIRQYVSASLFHGEVLQRPPMPPNSPNEHGEVEYTLELSRAIVGSIVGLWAEEEESETLFAHSEWILAKILLDHLGISNLISWRRPHQDDLFIVSILYGSLIAQAINFRSRREKSGPSVRKRYFEWLYSRMLRKRIDATPSILEELSKLLKRFLFGIKTEYQDQFLNWAALQLLRELYNDFPEPIKKVMDQDEEFLDSLGIRKIVLIEDFPFDPQEFWSAAAKVANGQHAQAFIFGSGKKILLQPGEDKSEKDALLLIDPETGQETVVRIEGLELLNKSPAARKAFLQGKKEWFDCDRGTYDKIVTEIVSEPDFLQRLETAEKWRTASPAVYYKQLQQELQELKRIDFDLLRPPSAQGFLRHFRVPLHNGNLRSFGDIINLMVELLVDEEDLATAFERLSAFPIPLHERFIKVISELKPHEKRVFIDEISRNPGSPLSRFHLAYLLLYFTDELPELEHLAHQSLARLLSEDGLKEIEVLLTVLQWVDNDFRFWSETSNWLPQIRLAMAWAHAHKLFSIFSSMGISYSWLQEVFREQASQRLTREMFDRDLETWHDIAHPRHVNSLTFLINALEYSLGEKDLHFLSEEQTKFLSEKLFVEKDGHPIPVISIWRDVSLMPNSLGTFLNGSKVEKSIVPPDAELLTGESVKQQAIGVVKKLGENYRNASLWYHLYAILGDLPPYEDLSSELKEALGSVNYANLFEANPSLGLFAIQFASMQLLNLKDDELRSHLHGALLEITELLPTVGLEGIDLGNTSSEKAQKAREIQALLLEVGLNIALSSESQENVAAIFSDISRQIIETWPAMRDIAGYIIQRLYEELPIDQAQQVVKLLTWLRAQ